MVLVVGMDIDLHWLGRISMYTCGDAASTLQSSQAPWHVREQRHYLFYLGTGNAESTMDSVSLASHSRQMPGESMEVNACEVAAPRQSFRDILPLAPQYLSSRMSHATA